jgi:hypothetical protein
MPDNGIVEQNRAEATKFLQGMTTG